METHSWNRGFLPGEFHGQRNLADYSPSGCKKSDTTEATMHPCMQVIKQSQELFVPPQGL